MGKIFEALDKTGLADEIFQDHEKIAESPRVVETVITNPAPVETSALAENNGGVSPAVHEFRVVSLRLPGGSPVLPFDQASQASEQYRVLRTKIVQHARQPRVIVVSSPSAGDGKSVTALNLAGALALKGAARVVLIDGDLRRPSIWRNLGVDESPGLADVLAGTAELGAAIVQAKEYSNLCILTAGKSEHNPSELLDSEIFNSILARLKRMFNYVVIDSPPIATVADYDLLAAASDGVIVVIRPDHTNRQACVKVLDSIPNGKCLGVVMNDVSEWFLSKSHGYAAYYY